ncbi:hypothetical protein SAMN02799631_06122 [Methylobacterium sp. 174MFSha1.1]|uniref:hypothetical protein n=1 Tax=Methylobacterium sp. 174MFSha1.1 TaxID=1502749 RepID=UPI0008E2FE42|nr:hypothetical protein [Methylobacterium sp. 174MFSha1.1]SFV15467.1 hypothetical protein SAMN02799631_06122 [Methylobacterium sp. 174MFSha1.1]
MSSELTQSGTPEGESDVAAPDAGDAGTGSVAVGEDGVSVAVSVAEAESVPDPAPPSMFRPTMRDVGASASEVGPSVAPRPLMPVAPVDGEDTACPEPDAADDQALILGPSDPQEAGTTDPVAEAEGGTPALVPTDNLADGTNLFGDRAAMWSGDPSEVGTGYGLYPAHEEVCLCDEVTLAADETV